jgi:hypothetical protein
MAWYVRHPKPVRVSALHDRITHPPFRGSEILLEARAEREDAEARRPCALLRQSRATEVTTSTNTEIDQRRRISEPSPMCRTRTHCDWMAAFGRWNEGTVLRTVYDTDPFAGTAVVRYFSRIRSAPNADAPRRSRPARSLTASGWLVPGPIHLRRRQYYGR